ncbi:DnaJ isogeny subfamily B member 12 [Heracleum sosnowskyi]|uniref:DnaJ isogeny subfamily B member 12 n=1 Tax=Heracleum sosnowskyi TaxID=360622 RepID=A0AAD8N4T9_9APIA|nr:DnaJ isogeny subfamily B member 12 [Heracleum sosnowskyi]
MEDAQNSDSRGEAERLLGISEKFLTTRDLSSCRDFALLAQETAPLLDGSDQILAVVDVLLAAETKKINNKNNWYAILQLDNKDNVDSIKKQYRRLALLLHPDKNKFAFANEAFQIVADAWAVLSDVSKRSVFDRECGVDLVGNKNVNREKGRSFWTMCPYCYNLYEYPRIYKDCCLKCGNCKRAIHGTEISSLPPLVQGQDAYYCCWGFFPMGFAGNDGGGSGRRGSGFPQWVPPMFGANVNGGDEEYVENSGGNGNVTPVHRNVSVTPTAAPTTGVKRGRGRPRKNPQ